MPPPEVGFSDVALIGFYIATLWIPGLLAGTAAGLRGWTLAAAAPLLTYAIAGLAGPWTTSLGIRWSPLVFVVATIVFVGVLFAVRGRRRTASSDQPPPWSTRAQIGAGLMVGIAAAVGAYAILRGIHRITTIPQDWDAVFHADGIRWIAQTGDAGLFGMSQINWYEGGAIFYPNAYHVVGSAVFSITSYDTPAILNSQTVLLPGMAALTLAALVRRMGGTAVHAAATAAAVVASSSLYDMLWRGPLLPFATGVVLTPVFVLLLAEFLDSRGVRARLGSGVTLSLGAAGLLCIHPAMLFGAVVFGLPYLVWRWARQPRRLHAEPLLVAGAAVAGLALSFQQIRGSLYSAASFPAVDWPVVSSWRRAVFELATFGHAADTVQVWLTVLAVVGVVLYWRLGELRWLAAPIIAFGFLFVITASFDAPWVQAVTRPWWNDRFRLAGLFVVAAAPIVGHGLAQLSEAAAWLLRRLMRRFSDRTPPALLRALPAVAALIVFVAVSHVLYVGRNASKMSQNTGEGPAVSSGEVAAMAQLRHIVPPGVRVMNDRYDGSVWMYALDGVLPVAGHYDATNLGETDIGLLERSFDLYGTDPEVADAVRRLDVGYVMIGQGFLRADNVRAPGLVNLAGQPWLREVFRNPQAVIYQVLPLPQG
ncbi:DUF6541 family protein [Pseudonocardia dioxanivorans]|uniref:DUF6541 family protein n=1 Tax=Pseudonocardia dioxanivorans TaxID=240495 RepID=UPI000CD0B7E5|nr:DUF6541 family protein [Pseudonocardia dioxanivorans]